MRHMTNVASLISCSIVLDGEPLSVFYREGPFRASLVGDVKKNRLIANNLSNNVPIECSCAIIFFLVLLSLSIRKKWFPLEAFGLTTFPFRRVEIKEIRS